MTIRNEMKLMYGKLVLNGSEVVELGRAAIPELSQRVTAVIKSRIDLDIESWNFYASADKVALAKMMKGGVQAEYEHEGLNPDSPLYGLDKSVIESMVMIEDDTPSPFEGITMNRLMEANTSSEFEAYRLMACNPEKRVGVDSNHIAKLRMDWEAAYPDVAAFIPPWKE